MREVLNLFYVVGGILSLIYGVLTLLKVVEPPEFYVVAALAYICIANILIDSVE